MAAKTAAVSAKPTVTTRVPVSYLKPRNQTTVKPQTGGGVAQTGGGGSGYPVGPLMPFDFVSVPGSMRENQGTTGYSGLVLHGPGQGARVVAGQQVSAGLPATTEDLQAKIEESVTRLGGQFQDFLVQNGGWIVALVIVIALMVVSANAFLKG